MYTVREAARVLGYHPFSVYRLVCRGTLRHTRLGPKTLLFSREDLIHYQERVKRRRPRKGKPMDLVEPLPTLVAEIAAKLARRRRAAPQKVQQFRWENVPLIRARMDARYGASLRGVRISVRGREGEAWRVVYEAPRGNL